MVIFIFLFFGAWLVWKAGQRNIIIEQEYNRKYEKIEKIIETYKVEERNYNWIQTLLEHLGQMEYKDGERTSVLSNKFWLKYTDIRLKRLEL